jgi:Holliday junction resolvase RusA-like endonuclease
MISFFVPGIPRPGGSKRAFVNKKTGRAMIVEDCKKNPEWRSDCKSFALQAYSGPPLTGALFLKVFFFLPRPKSHFGTGQKTNDIKASSPLYPTVKPDCTKLIRALEDALTGVIWRDDSQIVTQIIQKRYGGERAGALVEIYEEDV